MANFVGHLVFLLGLYTMMFNALVVKLLFIHARLQNQQLLTVIYTMNVFYFIVMTIHMVVAVNVVPEPIECLGIRTQLVCIN